MCTAARRQNRSINLTVFPDGAYEACLPYVWCSAAEKREGAFGDSALHDLLNVAPQAVKIDEQGAPPRPNPV